MFYFMRFYEFVVMNARTIPFSEELEFSCSFEKGILLLLYTTFLFQQMGIYAIGHAGLCLGPSL